MRLNEIEAALQSDDPATQDRAIATLEEIGSAEAIRVLAGCLEYEAWRQEKGFDPDWRGPGGERLQGRSIYEPLSHLAAKALARLIPDPPVSPGTEPITEAEIREWRKWWAENEDRYGAGPAGGLES